MHSFMRRVVPFAYHPANQTLSLINNYNACYLIKPAARPWRAARALSAVKNMAHIAPRTIQVSEDTQVQSNAHIGRRLDAVLPELFPGQERFNSETGAKRAIRRKEVHVNGSAAKTDSVLHKGDVVQLVTKVGGGIAWPAAALANKPGLDVAYEDDHMACVIKPQGIETQGNGEGTVQGRIKYCLQPTPLPRALFRPHQAHRLDVGTGGLLLVAKTRTAAAALAGDLAKHNMQKRYLALVIGRLEGSGIVDYPLKGKPATSLFSVVDHSPSESFGWLTWVSLWPATGRTHQLRKHMAYIGHPVLGDLLHKHRRKPDCQVLRVQDVQQHLPQLDQLAEAAAAGAEAAAQGQQGTPAGVTSVAAQQQQLLQQPEDQQLRQPLGLETQSQQQEQQPQAASSAVAAAAATARQQHADTHSTGISSTSSSSQQTCAVKDKQHGDEDMGSAVNDVSDDDDASMGDDGSSSSSSSMDNEHEGSEVPCGGISSGSSSGSRQRGQVLRDGSVVGTCLWAVQLQLLHPVTRQPMDISIDTPVSSYKQICSIEAAGVAGATAVVQQ